MLLAIDVGNTNITFGVFEGKQIRTTFRMTTKIPRTSDEYGISILELIERSQIDPAEIKNVVISSVVPDVMHSLNNAMLGYLKVTPMIVGQGLKTGIRVNIANPAQIGADRIVDAVGGLEAAKGPVIVIDFGTATTYDLIDGDGTFVTGITAPGIRISAKALWEDTAKLPEIEILKPPSIMAKDTIQSMQAGLVYGQIGQTEYIIRCLKEESQISGIKVVATGGLGRIIAKETPMIDIYDPQLTLQGMRLIYEKNR